MSRVSPKADLASQVAAALRQRIFSREFAPGARLPSETVLASEFEVSRPTLREALSRLAAQGLIETRRGAKGGAFVAGGDGKLGGRLAELLGFAALWHRLDDAAIRAAYAAALGMAFTEPALPERTVTTALATLQEAAPGGLAAAHLGFHLSLCGLAPNPISGLIARGLAETLGEALSPAAPTVVDCGRIAALCARLAEAVAARDTRTTQRNIADWHAFLAMREDGRPAPPGPRGPA